MDKGEIARELADTMGERGMSALDLSDKYDETGGEGWGEHPVYTLWDWAQEVAQRSTRRGYWDWVACEIEGDYTGD